ncbi:hypothetical protein BKA80DRAFT_299854 [Phyllosticta citrichinensis]
MRARAHLVDTITLANTHEALSLELAETMDMLRLCRSDYLGMHYQVPSLLMRLGRDQEAYDFIKWWAEALEDSHFDWGNLKLPYLDTKNAVVIEPVDLFSNAALFETFDMMLLKVKVLLDLRALQRGDDDQVFTDVVRKRKGYLRGEGSPVLIASLEAQVGQIYKAVKLKNLHLWPAFLGNPKLHASADHDGYTRGHLDEAETALRYSYEAWTETPGAEDVVRGLAFQDPDFPW